MESYNMWTFMISIMFSRFIHVVACIVLHSLLLTNNVPLHRHTAFHSSIQKSMEKKKSQWILGFPPLVSNTNSASMNMSIHSFTWTRVLVSLGCIGFTSRRGIVGSCCNSTFHHLRNHHCVSSLPGPFQSAPFYFPTCIFSPMLILAIFDYSHASGYEVIFDDGFHLHCPNDS